MRVFTRESVGEAWLERSVAIDSVTVRDEVNERSTASVTLIDETGTHRYQRGTGVRVTDVDGVVMFQGFADRVIESRLGPGGARRHAIEAVDWHYVADKRLITRAYEDFAAGDIVRDLVATILAAEGVTEGIIEAGPTIRAVTFDYERVSDAILELANRAGYWWRINHDGSLDFAEPRALLTTLTADTTAFSADTTALTADMVDQPGTGPAALDIAAVAFADTVSVTRHTSGYRNRQWLKGGRDRTTLQVEVQLGDGERRAFALGFPVAEEPVVEVSRDGGAFVQETVGAAGLQTNRDWLWSYQSPVMQQNTSNAVLDTVDRVRVTYTGLFDVVARIDDPPLQADRAALEGGTGVVESVLIDKRTDTAAAAFQLAAELVAYYGRPSTVVRFRTDRTDLVPGVVTPVEYAAGGVEGDALVTTSEWFTEAGNLRAVVTMAIGPIEGSWAQWFGALSRRIDRFAELGGGEVNIITTLEQFVRDWEESDRPNIFRECRAGTAVAGPDTFPEFEPQHRVRYMAWFDGGVERGRKRNTSQTGAASDSVNTTTVLVALDAVGDIEEFVWFGGLGATDAVGTGVEVDRVAFVTTKTDLEQIQVQRTDNRWED